MNSGASSGRRTIARRLAGSVAGLALLAGPATGAAPAPGGKLYGPTETGTPLAALATGTELPALPDREPQSHPGADTDSEDGDDGDGPANPATPPEGAVESLRDAIVAALKDNPEIQIALAQQDDAHYAVAEARAALLPHLDLSFGYGEEFARSGTQAPTWRQRLEATATVNQNLWDFGVTANDIRRARASYRSAQWATRERIEGITYDIATAYLGVLQQQKLVDLTAGEIEVTGKIRRMVTVQKDLGLTTAADISRAKTRIESLQSQLLDRRSALQQARNAYRRLTDHLPGIVVALPGADKALPASADDAVAMIDEHNPGMAQGVEDRRSLARQYDSQKGNFFPRLGIVLQGNHKYDVQGRTGMANDARAMVTVNYALFNGGSDMALRRRIGARIRQADYELDRRRRKVAQDIRSDFDALQAARQKIATITAEIDAAQRVADLYRQQFREGKRTVFDLLDSEQNLFAARSNEITNRIALNGAEYRVLQNLGGLFDLVSQGEPLPPIATPVSELNAARERHKATAKPDSTGHDGAPANPRVNGARVANRK
ncbi:MAG: TolC family outer membrane protein [Sphingomonadales bacterium]|nr:TolC family outer membrane protein [Sphingomonadales bacterium]